MPGRSPTKLLGGNQVVTFWDKEGGVALPWSPEAGPEWTGTRVLPGQGLFFKDRPSHRPAVKVGDTALAYVLHDHHKPSPP